jgi:tetratricopeptide (TPR) repeat protein
MTAKMLNTAEPLKTFDAKHNVWVGPKEAYYYKAVDFLEDGIRKNPRDSSMYFDLGYGIYYLKLADYANAATYLRRGVRYRHEKFMRRMFYHALTKSGQYEESIRGWEDYIGLSRPTRPS